MGQDSEIKETLVEKWKTRGAPGLKMAPGARNWMRICAITRLRRSGSRFSGQNRPRSSEMRVYIEITGHIKNHQNFKFLFFPGSPKNRFLRFFRKFFTKKWAGNPGRESRVRRPGASSETPWTPYTYTYPM